MALVVEFFVLGAPSTNIYPPAFVTVGLDELDVYDGYAVISSPSGPVSSS